MKMKKKNSEIVINKEKTKKYQYKFNFALD